MRIKALATLFVFAIVFVICFLYGWQSAIAQTRGFHGGDGTADNPYQVSTAEQLNLVRNYLDAHFIQVADIDMGNYLAEGGAGYNDGEGWLPIGEYDSSYHLNKSFKGTYDGQDYKIMNLYINRPEMDYVGLFGYVATNVNENAYIKGVHLVAANVTGRNHVGGLIGGNYRGIIERCSVTGSILANGYRVGGLMGTNQGRIYNCYSKTNVIGEKGMIGGLVGAHETTYARTFNSYSTGFIDQSGQSNVGGLIGYLEGNENVRVFNSFYDKNTSGRSDTGKGVGKTTTEMKQQATYTEWDFENIWSIDENINDGYPYLRVANTDRIEAGNGSETEGELSTNALLRELTILKVLDPVDDGEVEDAEVGDSIGEQLSMQPEFKQDVLNYEISVTESVYEVRLMAVTDDDAATIKINEIEVESGQYSKSITLNMGENIITVLSIAEDGINQLEYNVVITRIQNSSQDPQHPQEPEEPEKSEEPEKPEKHEKHEEPEEPEEPQKNEREDVIATIANAIDYKNTNGNAHSFKYDPDQHILRILIDSKNYIHDANQQKITINLDDLEVVEAIASIDAGVTIEITISNQAINTFAVAISSDTAAILSGRSVTLCIKTDKASYIMPIKLITKASVDLDMPSDSLDSIALDSIIHIEIAELDAGNLYINNSATNYINIINPTEFRVYTISGSETVEINQFSEFVVREVILSSDIDNGIFTNDANLTRRHIEQTYSGAMLAEDGSLLHIPTLFVFKDGAWRAQMQSMSNSIYGLATKEQVAFIDLDGHCVRDTIMELAGKRIIRGVIKDGDRYFYPNERVTYAEFITLLTRAMGLYKPNGNIGSDSSDKNRNNSIDNEEENWYEESLEAAIFYKLIDSNEHMLLRLQQHITRREASEFIQKALTMIDKTFASASTMNDEVIKISELDETTTRADAAVIIRKLLDSFWYKHIE